MAPDFGTHFLGAIFSTQYFHTQIVFDSIFSTRFVGPIILLSQTVLDPKALKHQFSSVVSLVQLVYPSVTLPAKLVSVLFYLTAECSKTSNNLETTA